MKKKFDLAYRYRGVLMVPPYLALVGWYAHGQPAYDWDLGFFLFGLGILLRVWAQMHVHYRLAIRKTLTITGPYAYVRNPIYIGNTLILAGLTLLSGMYWFLPLMVLWCAVVYAFVVRREEAHLLEKYGQPYQEFLDRVPRWFPRLVSEDRGLLMGSLRAEAHCLLWLLPFAVIALQRVLT